MNLYNLKALIGLLFLSLQLNAESKSKSKSCTPEDVIARTCQFFKDNADKKEFKISDGTVLNNPHFVKPVNYDQSTQVMSSGYGGMGTSSESMMEFTDREIMFQLEVEKIFEKSVVSQWPKRSQKYLTNSFHISALLSQLYPTEEKYKSNYGYNEFAIPHPITDPQAKPKNYSQQEIIELISKLGKDNFEKIKKAYDDAKFNPSGGGITTSQQGGMLTVNPSRPLPDRLTNKKRQQKLFNYAKEKMRQMIIGGRKEKDLTEYDRNLLKRVDNVQLGDSEQDAHLLACTMEKPNAFFVPLNYKVYICPNALALSDANLAFVLGHEIGHSIDPCGSSCEHVKLNQSAIDSYLADTKPDDQSTPNEYKTDTVKYISSFGGLHANLANNADIVRLSEAGYLKSISKPVPADKHKFRNIKSCLIQHEHFDDLTEHDIESALSDLQSFHKRVGMPADKESINIYRDHLMANAACLGTEKKKSEMNEVMSDVSGTYVLSEYLKDHPPKNDVDSIASLGLFFEGACMPNQLVDSEILKRTHPLDYRRLRGVMLNFPGMLKNFSGCDSTSKASSCFSSFRYLENESQSKNGKRGQQ